VIGRVPGGLNPPVAAHHRGRHCHRLQPDHQVPGPDPAPPPAAVSAVRPSLPRPCRAGQATSATPTAITPPARAGPAQHPPHNPA
jgi:hypothetical protein